MIKPHRLLSSLGEASIVGGHILQRARCHNVHPVVIAASCSSNHRACLYIALHTYAPRMCLLCCWKFVSRAPRDPASIRLIPLRNYEIPNTRTGFFSFLCASCVFAQQNQLEKENTVNESKVKQKLNQHAESPYFIKQHVCDGAVGRNNMLMCVCVVSLSSQQRTLRICIYRS